MPATLIKKPRIFHGYWIALVSFLCLALMAGTSFYIFGLFVKPLEAEFGWGRAQVMGAATCFNLIQGVGSVFVGRLLNNYGTKIIIIAGAIIIGICIALISTINSLWQLYILYGLSGIGFAAIGFVPATSIVLTWFHKKRGTIIGFVSAGIGAGGLVMPLIVGNILIPGLGWRNAFIVIGLLPALILILPTLLIVKQRPEDMGLLADNEIAPPKEANSQKQESPIEIGFTMRQAFRTKAFWLIAMGGVFVGFSTVAITQNQVPHLMDTGFSVAVASGAVSVVGAFSGAGKFLFGFICDWINPKYSRAIGLILQTGSILILLILTSSSPIYLVWSYAVLLGLSYGSWVPAMSMLTSVNFGMKEYGTILGMMTLFNMIGGAIGPLVAGYIYDVQGSYQLAFVIFLILVVVTIIGTLFIRKPKMDSKQV